MTKYKHKETVHNLKDPELIVPEVIRLLNPKSVIDVGCGLGTFLHVFKRHGVTDIMGLDGSWVDKDLLYKFIQPEEFQEWDLEENIKLDRTYDLVVSLEVAEHLSERSAETFIHNLVNLGSVILFSAAIPMQGGQNHINEQWLSYWAEKFAKHDFVIYDVIRPLIWENKEILWWYRQNMVIVAPAGLELGPAITFSPLRDVVSKDLYTYKSKELQDIKRGKVKRIKYLNWFLISIFGYQNLNSIKRRFKEIKRQYVR